jgi:hypothetical protein
MSSKVSFWPISEGCEFPKQDAPPAAIEKSRRSIIALPDRAWQASMPILNGTVTQTAERCLSRGSGWVLPGIAPF